MSWVSGRSPLCPRGLKPMVLPHMTSLRDAPCQRKNQATGGVEAVWEDVKYDHSGKCRVSSGQHVDSLNIKERDPRVTFWSLEQQSCARCRACKPWQQCAQVCWWASKRDHRTCIKADKSSSAMARVEEQAAERCRLCWVTWPKRQWSFGGL